MLNGVGIHKDGREFNPGFSQLKDMAVKVGIPLIVYLHADAGELKEKKYNEQGDEIIAWAKANGITLIKELDYNFTPADYRDGIHLSKDGQRKLADIMEKRVKV